MTAAVTVAVTATVVVTVAVTAAVPATVTVTVTVTVAVTAAVTAAVPATAAVTVTAAVTAAVTVTEPQAMAKSIGDRAHGGNRPGLLPWLHGREGATPESRVDRKRATGWAGPAGSGHRRIGQFSPCLLGLGGRFGYLVWGGS